ncbi:MAG: polyribonucleotide nucleotidyltransferase, partial [Bacteroidales bacterium]|nr:polyribonucleotide nucleotidyltransferase [Bacteroidales bacterium]
MYKLTEKIIDLGDGRTITIETGKLAKQADGSVVVRMGKTMLLATVVSAKEAKEDVDFMPLSVEYKEKFASSGRFPGGFMKREARPSDYEILVSRLVDRALRPLFPEDFHAETFVTINLISADTDIIPDALAGLAASSALAVSNVPFNGPISEVRIARINGSFIINPAFSQLKESDIDMVVAATKDNILMVEGELSEISENDMIEAIKFAHEAIKKQCLVQEELAAELGIQKREYSHEENDEELKARMENELYEKVLDVARSRINDKHARTDAFAAVKEEFIEKLTAEAGEEGVVNKSLV